jgi:hypothetical protein
MSNLVPQFAKKKITTEYWLRVLTAWFFLWGTALLVGTVLLFPVYIFTSIQIGVNAESAASAEESVESFESAAADLRKASLQARSVIEDGRRTKVHEYVALFAAQEGNGVEITSIGFSQNESGPGPITVRGTADSREALAAFRERLLNEASIAEANLPISNLARDRDIDFDITVIMANNPNL